MLRLEFQTPFKCFLVGLMNMNHDGAYNVYTVYRLPPIFLTDITQFLLAHGDVALTNDMLKDYKAGKVYEYILSGWLQEAYFLKTKSNNNNNLCILF